MNVLENLNKELEKNLREDYIIYKEDSDLLDEKYVHEILLWEMANVVGKYVKSEREQPNFSFHFLGKDDNMKHAIRVKITWNPDHIKQGQFDGYIEAHGDYRYYQSPKSNAHPTKKAVDRARMFVRKNKVLFAAVWEGIVNDNIVQDYFRGKALLYEVVSQFELPNKIYYKLNYRFIEKNTLTELENRVREYHAFNMNDQLMIHYYKDNK